MEESTLESNCLKENPPIEITDAHESYIEKFRAMLIDLYETMSVSVINASIAGDNLIQMAKRSDRDVIRYQLDLVLINGVLNWDTAMGSTQDYKAILKKIKKKHWQILSCLHQMWICRIR